MIIGDLAVDYTLPLEDAQTQIFDLPSPLVGGTALNAAKSFLETSELFPILFGRIGDDLDGEFVLNEINRLRLTALIGRSHKKRTGTCTLLYNNNTDSRIMIKDERRNANDYYLGDIEQALQIAKLSVKDFVFLICHSMVRIGMDHADKMRELIANKTSNSRVVLDLVPHNMYEVIDRGSFLEFCRKYEHYAIIAEMPTISGLLCEMRTNIPTEEALVCFSSALKCNWLILRFGAGNIGMQAIYRQIDGQYTLVRSMPTGYENYKLTNESDLATR